MKTQYLLRNGAGLAFLVFAAICLFLLCCGSAMHQQPANEDQQRKQQVIVGFVVDNYGTGKLLSEEELARLHKVVQKRKRVEQETLTRGSYGHSHRDEYRVFVKTIKDEPDVFENQYVFSRNFRHVQIRSRFFPDPAKAPKEAICYEIDKEAQKEIAYLCGMFNNEEREQRYYFDGMVLTEVPNWRTLIEPWVETDQTIGGDFDPKSNSSVQ